MQECFHKYVKSIIAKVAGNIHLEVQNKGYGIAVPLYRYNINIGVIILSIFLK